MKISKFTSHLFQDLTAMNKKKNENDSTQRVCYIRMSEYFKRFYIVKYGGEPVRFPENHTLQVVLEENLCENRDLRLLTKECFSRMAFHYDRDGKIFDLDIACPDEDRKSEYLEVCIPDMIYNRRGLPKQTSDCWQLNKTGAERFRFAIKNEFWSDCIDFIRDCKARGAAIGEDVTIENAMSDFMLMYDIPMSHYESMLKAERRARLHSRPDEAKKKHQLLEEKTGNVFIYT